MPWQGTIQRPSPGSSLLRPKRPLRLVDARSAIRIAWPRIVSRVSLRTANSMLLVSLIAAFSNKSGPLAGLAPSAGLRPPHGDSSESFNKLYGGVDPGAGVLAGAGAACKLDCPPLIDPPPTDERTTSGFSGCMLFKSVSTGMACVGGVTGTGPVVCWPGVCMGVPVLGGKNGRGYFGCGTGCPAGMGRTISGVTITMSSVFDLLVLFD